MKTMLIPVDFSDTSNNAVNYAVEWAKAYKYEQIVLLKTLYNSLFDSLIPSAGFVNMNEEYMNKDYEEANKKLNELGKDVQAKAGEGIKVGVSLSELPLVRSIMELVNEENPEIIVIGSDNYDYSSNSFVGGNVISIAKLSPVRVLIVPSHFKFRPVEEALVPVNYSTIDTLGKIERHSASSPHWKPKKLLVLNVDPKEKYRQPDEVFEKTEKSLHALLQNFPHEIFYTNQKSIIEGLMEFANKHDVQLIIALPGKHSFLYSLTHASISEAIYRNAQHPVMILK